MLVHELRGSVARATSSLVSVCASDARLSNRHLAERR